MIACYQFDGGATGGGLSCVSFAESLSCTNFRQSVSGFSGMDLSHKKNDSLMNTIRPRLPTGLHQHPPLPFWNFSSPHLNKHHTISIFDADTAQTSLPLFLPFLLPFPPCCHTQPPHTSTPAATFTTFVPLYSKNITCTHPPTPKTH